MRQPRITSHGSWVGSLPKLQGHEVRQLHASMTSPRIRHDVPVAMTHLPLLIIGNRSSPLSRPPASGFAAHRPALWAPRSSIEATWRYPKRRRGRTLRRSTPIISSRDEAGAGRRVPLRASQDGLLGSALPPIVVTTLISHTGSSAPIPDLPALTAKRKGSTQSGRL